MANSKPTAPDQPEQPVVFGEVLDEVERRKRMLRDQIHIRSGQIIDLKAARRWPEARTVEQEIARLRRELAELSPTDVWTRPSTGAGGGSAS